MDGLSESGLINGSPSLREDKCDTSFATDESYITKYSEPIDALPDHTSDSSQNLSQEAKVSCDMEVRPSQTSGGVFVPIVPSATIVSDIDKVDADIVSLIDIEASLDCSENNGCGDLTITSTESNKISSEGQESSNAIPTGTLCTEHSELAEIVGNIAHSKEDDTLLYNENQTQCDTSDVKSGEDASKTFSSYAILPGELTNELIEGPSITLPPSELQNQSLADTSKDAHPEVNSKLEISPLQLSESIAQDNSLITSAEPLGQLSTNDTNPPDLIGNDISTQQQITPSVVNKNNETTRTSENSASSQSKSEPLPAATSSSSNNTAVKQKIKKTPHDFIFGKVLGEGSYSTVHLAKEVSSQKEFAIKVCDKKHLIRERKTHFVMREKEVLMKLDHPFFIKLAYTFQDPERLYYVLTYARNGELLTYLHKLSVFDVPCTRFYSAELVLALEYLQNLGIVHRDLKPENILFGEDMHIKITDFGTSKIMESDVKGEGDKNVKRKNSFVGTAEYVSPEVLNNLPANYGSDIWALGCIIYQCLSSSPPFRCGNEYQTFQRIVKLEYEFPDGFNEEAKDLVQKLMVIEPSERLGMRQPHGMAELKAHDFFHGIAWDTLPNTTPPKLLPYLPATGDNPEFWGGQEHRTGFDDQRLAEIITGQSIEGTQAPELEIAPVKNLHQMEEVERREKMAKQRTENPFHPFVEDNLILRQGFVDKRKGLFARKRMLLLTEGPHLYYVDAHNKVLKGEIPWSKSLRPEAKNFKIFFVHTPNRTYYLESRNPDAHLWVKHIEDVWKKYYSENEKD